MSFRIKIYFASGKKEYAQKKQCIEIFNEILDYLRGQSNKEEFSVIEKFEEISNPCQADFAVGFPTILNELNISPERPISVIMFLSHNEWGDDVNQVLQSPRYDIWGIFRISKMLHENRDPEEFGTLTALVKKLLRRLLRSKGLHEEDFSKPIEWKAKVANQNISSGFISLLSEPATQRLARKYKDALLDLQKAGFGDFYEKKAAKHTLLSEYQSELNSYFTKAPSKKGHVPSMLILGETGCGKSLLAKMAAQVLTPGKQCTRLNISAYTQNFIDTTLFGALNGSYTGLNRDDPGILIAHAGEVVFLDEFGDMDAACQTRLLTYMDDCRVRPRGMLDDIIAPCYLIAATNKDIDKESSLFRQDIVHRFDHIIKIPPLRDRKDDLPLLVSLTLQNDDVNPRRGESRRVERISLDAVQSLNTYNFPGNFRELEFILRQAVNMAFTEGSSCICTRHIVTKE